MCVGTKAFISAFEQERHLLVSLPGSRLLCYDDMHLFFQKANKRVAQTAAEEGFKIVSNLFRLGM